MAGMQPELAMEMESDHTPVESSVEYDSEEINETLGPPSSPELAQQEIEQEHDPERRKQLERNLYGSRYVWRNERVELLAREDGPVLERIPWSPLIPEFVQFSEDEVVALEKERAELTPLAGRPSGPVQELFLAFVMGGHPRLGSKLPLSLLSGTPEMFQEILKLCAPLDIAMRVYNLQYSTSIVHDPQYLVEGRHPLANAAHYQYEQIWWRKVVLKALYVHYNQRTVHVVGGYVPDGKKKFFTLLHQVMWRQADAGEDGVEDIDQEAQTWMWRQADPGDEEEAEPHAFQRALTVELDLYRDHKRQLAEILKILTGKKNEGEDAQNNHIIWILNIPAATTAFLATRLYATLKLILQYAAEPYSVVVMKGTSIEDEMINTIVKDVIVTHEKPDLEQVRTVTERFRNSYIGEYWDFDGSFKAFTTEADMWKSHFLRDFMGECSDVCSTLLRRRLRSTPTTRDRRYWLYCSEEMAATHHSF